MAHSLFGDVVEPERKIGNRNRYTLSLSILVHVLIVTTAIVMPVAAPRVLMAPVARLPFVAARPIPPEPPPPPRPVARADAPAAVNTEAAPLEAPSDIIPVRSLTTNVGLPGAVEDTPGATAGAGIPGGLGSAPLPAPQHVDPPPPVRTGGDIKPPARIKDVRPIYPVLAQAAKVEGLVIIEATIGPTGRVQDAKVLRSHPMLEAAALDAVRQWEFTPTLLNSNPVAVIMTVTVDFRLR